MASLLINAIQPDEVRIAVTENKQLIDLDIEQSGFEQKKSNIYKGVITSIEPSLGAVFVDYGVERHGFLPVKEISKEYFNQEYLAKQNNVDISSMDPNRILKIGQQLVIQIEKEERGNKGAALTTFISLAGSFLVLMPNNPRAGGISRRIEGDDRDQLKDNLKGINTPEGMGVIIRTACVGKTTEELNWDLEILLKYWEAIKQAAIVKPGPYLIHQESDVIIRSIRDYLRHDIEEIIIDEEKAYERAKSYLTQIRPEFLDKLNLYTDTLPIFSRFQIEQQIENAYQGNVNLPSGGSLVIDHTEALVSVDINSARATKGSSIEETAYNTNMEAAEEIARQMRIRDIGGLIVIDFIDMLQSSHQRAVENCLRQALRLDRARIQIGRISRFGLLEMSRQRIRSALIKNTQTTCPRCCGRGTIRTVESLTLSIIHLIEEQAVKAGSSHLQVQLPIDIATFLLNEKRNLLNDIQMRTHVNIVVIANHHLDSPAYQIKLVKDDHGKNTPSYKLVKIPKVESVNRKTNKPDPVDLPAINEFLSKSTITPPLKKSSSDGFLKKLWEVMFGNNEAAVAATNTNENKIPAKRQSDTKKTPQSENGNKQTTASRKNQTTKRQGNTTTRRGNRGGQQKTTSTKPTQNNETPRQRQPRKTTTKQSSETPKTQSRKTTGPKDNTPSKTQKHGEVTSHNKATSMSPTQNIATDKNKDFPKTSTDSVAASKSKETPKKPIDSVAASKSKETPKKPIDSVAASQSKETPKKPIDSVAASKSKETPKKPIDSVAASKSKETPKKPIDSVAASKSAPKTPVHDTLTDQNKDLPSRKTANEKKTPTSTKATAHETSAPKTTEYKGLSGNTPSSAGLQQVITKKKASIKAKSKDEKETSTQSTNKNSDE